VLRAIEIIIIAFVGASLAAGTVFAIVLSPPPSPCSGVIGATRSFTVIVDQTGYNGSDLKLDMARCYGSTM